MRLSAPRIQPVDPDRLDPDQNAVLAPLAAASGGKVDGGKILNIFLTLARTPKAAAGFLRP
jgi:hypothetical protein